MFRSFTAMTTEFEDQINSRLRTAAGVTLAINEQTKLSRDAAAPPQPPLVSKDVKMEK
jgi:hypothetical protein